ncbi:30S ribosomal protein S13 [Candidatus Tiddalikarchaeum anstoanum]|nr:30S ribosomal protein S13 [Candidatus Tiddalikarchaeum anstoanum]
MSPEKTEPKNEKGAKPEKAENKQKVVHQGKPEKEKREDYGSIVRIYNTDLNGKKQILIGLSKIRGIGTTFAHAVLHVSGIPENKLTSDLKEADIAKIETVLKNPVQNGIPAFLINRQGDLDTGQDRHVLGNDLKLQNEFDIRRMKRLRSYKGLRHGWGLKVRGQRTKSTGRHGGPAVAKKKTVVKK